MPATGNWSSDAGDTIVGSVLSEREIQLSVKGVASKIVNTLIVSTIQAPWSTLNNELQSRVLYQQIALQETVAYPPTAHLLPSLAAVREELQDRPGHGDGVAGHGSCRRTRTCVSGSRAAFRPAARQLPHARREAIPAARPREQERRLSQRSRPALSRISTSCHKLMPLQNCWWLETTDVMCVAMQCTPQSNQTDALQQGTDGDQSLRSKTLTETALVNRALPKFMVKCSISGEENS